MGASMGSGRTPSFQSSDNMAQNSRKSDPFYLNSSPATLIVEEAVTTNNNVSNRFGNIQIQLGDDEVENSDAKKKKKKKGGKHKTGVKGMQQTNNAMEQGFGNMTIYGSDDEDDDNDNDIIMQPSKRSGGRKELNSLANVDLTFPLRPEEFIPEQRHRVVPERPTEIATTKTTMEPASAKTKKKKKKESKQKKKEMKQRTI